MTEPTKTTYPRYCTIAGYEGREPWHKVPCPRDPVGICLIHDFVGSNLRGDD